MLVSVTQRFVVCHVFSQCFQILSLQLLCWVGLRVCSTFSVELCRLHERPVSLSWLEYSLSVFKDPVGYAGMVGVYSLDLSLYWIS